MLPEISSAMLVVTHRCNLACRYCFVKQRREDMDAETAERAADFLAAGAERNGTAPSVNFFGGEPMLMWDGLIEPLVRRIRRERRPFRFSITTNGTLLTEERMDAMREYGFGLLLSMDGVRAVQDANRPFHGGGGSFEALERAVPGALRRWPGVTMRMTAAPWSCAGLFESIIWAEGAGFKSFFVVPDVFSRWDARSWALLEREVMKYAAHAAKRRAAGEGYIRFSSFARAEADLGALKTPEGRARLAALGRAENKCGLGAGRFASIAPDGGVYACQELCSNGGSGSPFYIGSIDGGISERRRRSLMEGYYSEPPRCEHGCGSCPYAGACDGGCAANNYFVTGRTNVLPGTYCRWKRLLLRAAAKAKEGER